MCKRCRCASRPDPLTGEPFLFRVCSVTGPASAGTLESSSRGAQSLARFPIGQMLIFVSNDDLFTAEQSPPGRKYRISSGELARNIPIRTSES